MDSISNERKIFEDNQMEITEWKIMIEILNVD